MTFAAIVIAAVAWSSEPPVAVKTLSARIAEQPEEAQRDVSPRIAEHIWTGGYVAPAALGDVAMKESVSSGVQAWIKGRIGAGRADAVANLYFVLGSGEKAPAWTAASVDPSGFRTAEWVARMRPWTQAAPRGKIGPARPGRLEPAAAADWPAAFLDDAAGEAARVARRPVEVARGYSLDRLGSERATGPGRGELRRFQKPQELLAPPKLAEAVPRALKGLADPVLKPVDAVLQKVFVEPVERLSGGLRPERRAALPAAASDGRASVAKPSASAASAPAESPILSPQDLHSAGRWSQADDAEDPVFLSQYAYALGSAGFAEGALAALDRAFAVDGKNPHVRFVASQVFAALEFSDLAGDLSSPRPGWLAAEAPSLGRLRYEHELLDADREIIAADFLRWQKRFASAAARFGRLAQAHPKTALAWEGLAVTSERLSAFDSAATAMQRYVELVGAPGTEENPKLFARFIEEMKAAAKEAGGTREAHGRAPARAEERPLSLSAFEQNQGSPVLAARYSSSQDIALRVPEEFTSLTSDQRLAWLNELFRQWPQAWIATHWPTGGAVWAMDGGGVARLALWSNGTPPNETPRPQGGAQRNEGQPPETPAVERAAHHR